jgi:hypothetical protein
LRNLPRLLQVAPVIQVLRRLSRLNPKILLAQLGRPIHLALLVLRLQLALLVLTRLAQARPMVKM